MALRDIARRWGIVGAAILWLARIVSPGEVFAQAPSQPDASGGSSASPPVSSQPPAPAQQPRAQTKPRSRPAPPPAQPASDIPANPNVGNLSPPDKPEPVLHARNAGLGPCTRAVERGSAAVIDAPHSAFSNWNTGAPNLHAFQSIVVETYRSPLAPRAASVILASPSANGCDATAIQIFPSARPCAEVEKDILKSSSMIGNLAHLGLAYLKIDGSYIRNIDQEQHKRLFIEAVQRAAHSIDLPLIAERVETEGERLVLREMGVGGIQGQLVGEPAPWR